MSFEAPAWYVALDELVPVVAGPHVAFIRRSDAGTPIHVDVQVALVAALARLRSIDDAKRRYLDVEATPESMVETPDLDALYDSYMLAVGAMEAAQARLDTAGRPDPILGALAASIALSRLAASFKSAHLLYRIGHATDAHAIMRVILEQIAWAHSAARIDDEGELAALQPTKAVKPLKALYPGAGPVYGSLNPKTHLDLSEHRVRVKRREGQFHIVQFDHILVDEDGVRPDPDRPFTRAMLDQLDVVETAVLAAAEDDHQRS